MGRPVCFTRYEMQDTRHKENCGLFGIFGDAEAVQRTYFGLHSLQHRGQESAGIASSDGELIQCYTGMGTVRRVFRSGTDILKKLSNPIAIGHVRYSTTGASKLVNSQPLLSEYSRGQVAVAHNGNLINATLLRDEYEAYGSIFKSTSDTEIIPHLTALKQLGTLTVSDLCASPRPKRAAMSLPVRPALSMP